MRREFISKQQLREYVWDMLEKNGISAFPKPCYGRIPNFVGADKACLRLNSLLEFKQARCVFCAPDFVLKPVRELVLKERKILVVALPHMKDFVEISEFNFIEEAVSIGGFKIYGKPLKSKIDLFIEGSVAVDLKGNRIGKGTGYGDREWEYLLKRGFVSEGVKVVTIVHSSQVFEDFSYLVEKTDKKVDYIVTEKQIIKV